MPTSGRVLAVGDIHGCGVALRRLLAAIDLQPSDTLVVLGDVVDRGPDSRDVLEQLLELQNRCRLVLVEGNHEEMMLDALSGGGVGDWWQFGGRETIESYGGRVDGVPESHLAFLKTGLAYWETDETIFVHANLEPGVSLANQQPAWLRWTHLSGSELPHPSGRRVVCGHTPQASGVPLVTAGWLCLDTQCWAGGFLTCVDVLSNEIWQARETGSLRAGLTLPDIV